MLTCQRKTTDTMINSISHSAIHKDLTVFLKFTLHGYIQEDPGSVEVVALIVDPPWDSCIGCGWARRLSKGFLETGTLMISRPSFSWDFPSNHPSK